MPPFTEEESRKMVCKFLSDVEFDISENEIDRIVKNEKDQRSIMASVIRAIANTLDCGEVRK